jgi:PAS domain S-box-containing protein
MKLDVKHPLPFYRRLLLENRILFFFAFLVVLFGAVILLAQYWITARTAANLLRDDLEATLDTFAVPLGESAERSDRDEMSALLKQAAGLDERIAYLLVLDIEGSCLASHANSPAASSWLKEREPSGTTFIESELPLVARGIRIGTLRVGVERRHVSDFAGRVVAVVGAVMVVPVLLVLMVARAVVRRAVKRLKELTRIAEEISIGNLDPRIDFGVHVNCWEIKNCQRTDCKAYMNLGQQCWYIDGTPCEGYEPRFPQKLQGCRDCEVYQLHRGDEIVQLADALKHMAVVLKESREEIVKSGDYQKRLIQNSIDGIVATDENGTITIFNQVAEDLIGISREQVVGVRNWRAFFKDGLENSMDKPLSYGRVRRIRGFAPQESAIKREDRKLVDVLLSGISLFERGRHLGKVFFFQDMREIKKLREELIRSERLAATGQAAAGISHSIKNILDGFVGGAYVFKQGKRHDDEEKMEMGWGMIERNMEIISSLVKDLLNFSRERKPDYQELDPATLIADTLASMGVATEDRIKVCVEVEQPCSPVRLDAHAFQQCLANLIRNAMEAIPENREGTVTVRHETDGDTAVFTVSDDGVGMSPGTVDKIKGGMYSTKGSKGTGLGLLVIQKIVKEHKGTLKIQSEEGLGSSFRIEIPAAGESAAA